MSYAGGASAALRNVVKRIAEFFDIAAVHTRSPKDDIDTMLIGARNKARTWAGIEEGEIERLRKKLSGQTREIKRLIREKRLSDHSAAAAFEENARLKDENKELKIKLRVQRGHSPSQIRGI